MVFFNYATMQMAAKIVYYGPGLCGKTTNLHYIYAKTSPQSRGEMVSLETETDRTLFFDLLPIDVGVIGGFKTRLQLYTIPGQVFYNTTRKLVLKGVDGIVYVADSQVAMQDANVESFRNLRTNLSEIGLKIEDIPLVVQLNKRDLPTVASVDEILGRLDPERNYESVEAVAATGVGVFETLKLISKLTLRTLRRRMTGEEPKQAPRLAAQVASFRVKESATPAASGTAAASAPPSRPAIAASVAAAEEVEEI
jgi:signal recognition particle receptor subunit beta